MDILQGYCSNYHGQCEDDHCYCGPCEAGNCEICVYEPEEAPRFDSSYCPPISFDQLQTLPDITL